MPVRPRHGIRPFRVVGYGTDQIGSAWAGGAWRRSQREDGASIRFAERLEAEHGAHRSVEAEARLRALRERVPGVGEGARAERGESATHTPVALVTAHLGETPPTRDDGRGACRCEGQATYERAGPVGIRPTPAGWLGVTLDRIG